MTDQVRALLIAAALLSVASGSAGFVGGRMTAPVPPAEVRYVQISAPAPEMPEPPEVAPVEPVAIPPVIEPAPSAAVDAKPPKVEAKPKAQVKPQAKPEAKPRPPAQKKSLPSCAVVEREYKRMSCAEKTAEYFRSTAEQIDHGRRCLARAGITKPSC